MKKAISKPKVSESWTIHEILEKHPEGEKIILKHLGANCFACTQSLNQKLPDCVMEHGIDYRAILKELNS